MSSNITDIKFLKGVGEKRAGLLKKLGITSLNALLSFYPRDYKDLTDLTSISELAVNEISTVRAEIITDITEHFIRKNMVLYKFNISDGTGVIGVTIFNNKYLAKSLHRGSYYIFSGKVTGGIFAMEMSSPEIYDRNYNVIMPVYNQTAGLSSKVIGQIIQNALSVYTPDEVFTGEIRKEYNLCDISYAMRNIHTPASRPALDRARYRLIFEELYLLQCGLMYFRQSKKSQTPAVLKFDKTAEFIKNLPFTPTNAQLHCIKECTKDMMQSTPMNRLLQGDVGSGKTVVAAALCYNAVKNGYQAIIMAPTVILAEQHFATFTKFCNDYDIRCVLVTGSLKGRQKNETAYLIESGEYDIIIGTSAMLSDTYSYKNVGLVITDEQHRFGVEQRKALNSKGECPHTLVMSATPIPRTLGMAVYGDLDVSILDEYPSGRQKVETYSVSENLRARAYNYVKKHLDEGRQGYIVCPLVDDGETDAVSATHLFEKLSQNEFKNYRLGLLHGKMNSAEKEDVMRRFSIGEIQLLISTTVIEVGIDVPNAAIMVIENAERFGLSQLHQLRGRIGRGAYKSTCIFITPAADATSNKRLSIMCKTNDGFKIAEEDLKLRGPGDFLGNRQHGLPELKIASFTDDISVLSLTQGLAKQIFKNDSRLEKPENSVLKKRIINMFGTGALDTISDR